MVVPVGLEPVGTMQSIKRSSSVCVDVRVASRTTTHRRPAGRRRKLKGNQKPQRARTVALTSPRNASRCLHASIVSLASLGHPKRRAQTDSGLAGRFAWKPSRCQVTCCQSGITLSLHHGHLCKSTGSDGAALRWILSYAAGENEAPSMTPLSSAVAFLNKSRALATTPSSYTVAPAISRTSTASRRFCSQNC